MEIDCDLGTTEINPERTGDVHGCRAESVGVVRTVGEYRLVAVRAISAGVRLFRIEGERSDRPSRYSLQVGEKLHVDLRPGHTSEEILDRYFWRFMNHSCQPNTQIRGEKVIASRDIQTWEAVTFNYNTTEWEMAEPFHCRCGSNECLKAIRGFRHLTAEQREHLIGVAPPLTRLLLKEPP